MPNKSFLHIGAPKTGSTTLQQCIFALHPEILYFGEDGYGWNTKEEALTGEKLVNADDLFFPIEQCLTQFAKKQQEANGRIVVYSNADVMGSRRPTTCANRLFQLMPDAHILIVLRNQYTALTSFYANHGAYLKPAPPSHFRRYVSFEDWLSWCIMFPVDTPAGNFLYAEIIDLYASLWGRNKINILLFEDFVADPDKFVCNLATLLTVDAEIAMALTKGSRRRVRGSARRLAWHKFRSQFLWNWTHINGNNQIQLWERFLDAGRPARMVIPDTYRRPIANLYDEGNSRLVREWGLDLGKYSYPLPLSN